MSARPRCDGASRSGSHSSSTRVAIASTASAAGQASDAIEATTQALRMAALTCGANPSSDEAAPARSAAQDRPPAIACGNRSPKPTRLSPTAIVNGMTEFTSSATAAQMASAPASITIAPIPIVRTIPVRTTIRVAIRVPIR